MAVEWNQIGDGFRIIKKRVSSKQKHFIGKLLGKGSVLQALCYEYQENDEKEFKETYGLSFKEADQALEAVRALLIK